MGPKSGNGVVLELSATYMDQLRAIVDLNDDMQLREVVSAAINVYVQLSILNSVGTEFVAERPLENGAVDRRRLDLNLIDRIDVSDRNQHSPADQKAKPPDASTGV